MPSQVHALILFVLMFVGCDTAVRQQQADEARQAENVAELKKLGDTMHEEQNKESSPKPEADER